MPTALICDDEPLMRANLREHLAMHWPELELAGEAPDGVQALRLIESLQPDVTFLDIKMPGLNGLQVAQLVADRTQVVFVTAHENYALQAFEAHAVDYLLKPVDPVRLGKMVGRLRQRGQGSGGTVRHLEALVEALRDQVSAVPPVAAPSTRLEWLQVDAGRQVRMVHVDDVAYFEADHKYTHVVGEDCDGLIRLSLKELIAGLDARHFQQVHRGAIVNRRYIRSVRREGDTMEIELRGRDERVRVSESHQHLFRPM